MSHKLSIFYLAAILVVLYSCGKDPGVPAYLRINEVAVVGDSTRLGKLSHEIYGVEVNVGADNRGSWQLRSLIPVLAVGTKPLLIYPIVKVNNLSNNFIVYPMLDIIAKDYTFVRGRTDTIIPTFSYSADVKPLLLQDFEQSNTFPGGNIVFGQKGRTAILEVNENLSNEDSTAVVQHIQEVEMLPGSEIYLEFDYFLEQGELIPSLDFTDANGNRRRLFAENFLRPNNKWTKVYWRFSELVGVANVSKAYLTFNLLTAKGQSKAKLYLDNIKLLQR